MEKKIGDLSDIDVTITLFTQFKTDFVTNVDKIIITQKIFELQWLSLGELNAG